MEYGSNFFGILGKIVVLNVDTILILVDESTVVVVTKVIGIDERLHFNDESRILSVDYVLSFSKESLSFTDNVK